MNFLILGLPRSRTAWLANFCTHDGLFCHHEALNGCHTMREYANKFKDEVGDSNTGLIFFDFKKYLPNAKIIVIDKNIERSVDFAEKEFDFDSFSAFTHAKKMLDELDGLHVKFEEIDERLEEIWKYVTDKPFDQKRADMLLKMRIQVKDVHDIDDDAFQELIENEKNKFK